MITVVHGNDIVASRKYFLDEKLKSVSPIFIREDEVTLTFLVQVIEGGGLFEQSKSIFIEQFLTQRKKGAEKEAVISYILNQGKTNNIFLWESKELAVSSINVFKGGIVKNFKLPSSLFVFLDSITPKNGKQLVKLFHQAIQSAEPEMVFFMIIKQIRLLLAIKDANSETISEVVRLQPWQRTKLERQAKLFDAASLKTYMQGYLKLKRRKKPVRYPLLLCRLLTFFWLRFKILK